MFKVLQFSSVILLAFFLGALVSACSPSQVSSSGHLAGKNAVERITIKTLRISVLESELAQSPDFAFFPAGHFGDKTQYNGRIADEFGGAYAVHCRSGKPFSIEVKYPQNGIARSTAIKVMERLLPPNSGEVVEHDDEDLKKMDARQPAEFFYYKGGAFTELLFANDSNTQVVQVNVWIKEN